MQILLSHLILFEVTYKVKCMQFTVVILLNLVENRIIHCTYIARFILQLNVSLMTASYHIK